jgi:hypothetical protein
LEKTGEIRAATAMAPNAEYLASDGRRPTPTPPSRTAGPAREDLEGPSDPEGRPRGRNGRYPGDDDRSQASHDEDQEDPPTDGRQLLGWAAKQVPDAKGRVISLGKRRGFPSKIVSRTPQQVAAAYRYARGRG